MYCDFGIRIAGPIDDERKVETLLNTLPLRESPVYKGAVLADLRPLIGGDGTWCDEFAVNTGEDGNLYVRGRVEYGPPDSLIAKLAKLFPRLAFDMTGCTNCKCFEHWHATGEVRELLERLKVHCTTGKVYEHTKGRNVIDTAFPELVARGYQSEEKADEQVRAEFAEFLQRCDDDIEVMSDDEFVKSLRDMEKSSHMENDDRPNTVISDAEESLDDEHQKSLCDIEKRSETTITLCSFTAEVVGPEKDQSQLGQFVIPRHTHYVGPDHRWVLYGEWESDTLVLQGNYGEYSQIMRIFSTLTKLFPTLTFFLFVADESYDDPTKLPGLGPTELWRLNTDHVELITSDYEPGLYGTL